MSEENKKTGRAQRRGSTGKPKAAKSILVICAALVAAAGLTLLAIKLVIPEIKLANAQKLAQSGKYEDAVSVLGDIAGYRNAHELRLEYILKRAVEIAGTGESAGAHEYIARQGLEDAVKSGYDSEVDYTKGKLELSNAQYVEAAATFEALGDYKDSADMHTLALKRNSLSQAKTLCESGDFAAALALLESISGFENADELRAQYDAQYKQVIREAIQRSDGLIATGAWYTLCGGEKPTLCAPEGFGISMGEGVKTGRVYGGLFNALCIDAEGKVSCIGSGLGKRAEIEALSGIKAASVGWNHILLLTEDGHVKAYGDDIYDKLLTSDWQGVAAVAAGLFHSIGVLEDGSVVACGLNTSKQCDISVSGAVGAAAGFAHSVVLMADGTVQAFGDNAYGQCDTAAWADVARVYAAGNATYALTNGGEVLFCGQDVTGLAAATGFKDIIALAPGMWHVAALRRDGALLYAGDDTNGKTTLQSVEGVSQISFESKPVNAVQSYETLEYISGVDSDRGPWIYIGHDFACNINDKPIENNRAVKADLRLTQNSLPLGVFAYGDTKGGRTAFPAVIARQNKAVFGQTGDYVTYVGNPKGVLIHNGKVYYDKKDASTMTVTSDGVMHVYDAGTINAETLLSQGIKESWSFGPILVRDSEVDPSVAKHRLHNGNFRSAIGMIEPYHFVSSVTDIMGSPTLSVLAKAMKDYGCVSAYNLDGGNSCGMTFMGEQISRHLWYESRKIGQRSMPDLFVMGKSENVPTTEEPYKRDPNTHDASYGKR